MGRSLILPSVTDAFVVQDFAAVLCFRLCEARTMADNGLLDDDGLLNLGWRYRRKTRDSA